MKQNREQTMRRGLIFNLQCSVPSTSHNKYLSTTCRMKWQLRVRLVLERFSIILWSRVSSSHNVAKIKKTNRHFLLNTISENKSEINYLLSHKQEIINNLGHSEIISKPLIEIGAILVQGVQIHRIWRVQQVIKTTLQTFYRLKITRLVILVAFNIKRADLNSIIVTWQRAIGKTTVIVLDLRVCVELSLQMCYSQAVSHYKDHQPRLKTWGEISICPYKVLTEKFRFNNFQKSL